MEKVKVGIIGCGKISGIYCQAKQVFEILDIVACADLIPERAKARAEEYGIPQVCSPEELLNDPEIELVVNLTIPQAHAEVCLAALEAGKHVYVEKPLGIDREKRVRSSWRQLEQRVCDWVLPRTRSWERVCRLVAS